MVVGHGIRAWEGFRMTATAIAATVTANACYETDSRTALV